MSKEESVVRFDEVTFSYSYDKPILEAVDFSVRRGSKITLMGQNGAGKSTIFQLVTGDLYPDSGAVHVGRGLSVATGRQVIPRDQFDLTVLDFFQTYVHFEGFVLHKKIDEILEVVHLRAPHDKLVRTFSGGQQARLLLASALIQDPDILLLDEPTNNLDAPGIEHLTQFLIDYQKTCIVISHDADFLNSFSDGVLYLDIHSKKVEQYTGNYRDVVVEIQKRIERENLQNARMQRQISEKRVQAEVFAHKGGKLRGVAKRMRQAAEVAEEEIVDVRQEDKTIRPFVIPMQEVLSGEIIRISSYSTMQPHEPVVHSADISLRKNTHLLLIGPNGIGKTTLLEQLASGASAGATITPGVTVGYYRQDFSTLNFEDTVYDSLAAVMAVENDERLRSTAAGFLITAKVIDTKIGDLSEGQKGLVAFARLVLQKPGLLILDEPTNHMNFRHLPVIAKALDAYQGAMILVSHVHEFVQQIRIDETLDLGR